SASITVAHQPASASSDTVTPRLPLTSVSSRLVNRLTTGPWCASPIHSAVALSAGSVTITLTKVLFASVIAAPGSTDEHQPAKLSTSSSVNLISVSCSPATITQA